MEKPVRDNVHSFPRVVISWEATQECNLACPFCEVIYQKNKLKSHNSFPLSTAEILKIGEEIALIYKDEKVAIGWTGGEPFLRPDFIQIVSCFKDKFGFIQAVNTNGVLLEKPVSIPALRAFDIITISLDGLEDIHDYHRGVRGIYKKVITNLADLISDRNRLGIQTQIWTNTTLTKYNIHGFKKLLRKVTDMGVDEVRFKPIQSLLRKDHIDELLGLKQEHIPHLWDIYAAHDEYPQLQVDMEYIQKTIDFICGKNISRKECPAGDRFFYLDIYGDAYPCCSFFPRETHAVPIKKALEYAREKRLPDAMTELRSKTAYNSCLHCLDIYFHMLRHEHG